MVCKLTIWLILLQTLCLSAQNHPVAALFRNETPLKLSLRFPFREIEKTTSDSTYFPSVLYYENDQQVTDSLTMSLRARGNFRRKHCFYMPLRLRFKKKDVAGSVFEGNKALKLVLPCHTAERFDDLITLEYICYKFYESVTPYVFSTRLVDITISDENKDPEKSDRVRGFLIEDDDLLAKRFNGKVIEQTNLHPLNFHDTSTVNHDFFQYMIGNTDWSLSQHHNAKMIETSPRKFIPVAYDFDMSGFVNPPYATINPELEIDHLQERVYRGYCQDAGVMQSVRSSYLKLEPEIWEQFRQYEADISPRTFENRSRFLEEFFVVLKDDRSFTDKILKKCRKIKP